MYRKILVIFVLTMFLGCNLVLAANDLDRDKQMYNNPSESVLASKSQYVFDEANRQMETIDYQYGALGDSQTVFRYADFDKYGNWQRREMEYKGASGEIKGQPVMTRTLAYY